MRVWLLLFVLVAVPLVSAEVVVTPLSNTLSQPWYESKSYQISLRNNNSYPIYNVSFSPLVGFSFPVGVDVGPNESKVVSYSVLTNELFTSRAFASTVSYFYYVDSVLTPVAVEVNVTDAGFVPASVAVRTNDSVVFHNLVNDSLELRDVNATGFPTTPLPLGGTVSRVFLQPANYSFYDSPYGYTGNVVVSRVNSSVFAHESANDVQVAFSLSSVLPSGTVQVTLLSGNISVGNNQTYPEALIEVRNTDPNLLVKNVRVSADRWASGFNPSGFDLPASGVQRILFNITPLVEKTRETNTTYQVKLTVATDNAGSSVRVIDVFVPYQNLDVLTIGGVNYTITVLGINDTIEACLQHMNEAGFEACLRLRDYFKTNVTVIKEAEAQYKFGEGTITSTIGQLTTFGGVAERVENRLNLYIDKQASVEAKVENTTEKLEALQQYIVDSEAARQLELKRQNNRFWIFIILGIIVGVTVLLNWVIESVEYLDAVQEARQI